MISFEICLISVSLYTSTISWYIQETMKITRLTYDKSYNIYETTNSMHAHRNVPFLPTPSNTLDMSLGLMVSSQIQNSSKLFSIFHSHEHSKNYNPFWDLQTTIESSSRTIVELQHHLRTLSRKCQSHDPSNSLNKWNMLSKPLSRH